MSYLIRRAIESDAPAIHEAHMQSILEVCAQDHSEEQLNAWGRRPYNDLKRVNSIKNDHVWVVESAKKIQGFAHVAFFYRDREKLGYLYGLYITTQVLKGGVGRALFNKVVEAAEAEGVDRITFSSTLTAHAFYQKMGCRDVPGPKTTKMGTVDIPTFDMEYWVKNAPPMLRLEKPSLKHVDSFVEAVSGHNVDSFYDNFDLAAFVKNPINQIQEWCEAETDPLPGRVPELHLWAIENEKYVGTISLRLALNESLKKRGGHVGYETARSARGRGVAKEMLRQIKLFPQAKAIRTLLLTCNENNMISEKVMMANGAVRVPHLVRHEALKKNTKHFLLNLTPYPHIETDRLILDRVVQADANDIFEYASSERVAEFVTWNAHKTIDDSYQFLSFIANASVESAGNTFYVFAIREKVSQKMIGSFQFTRTGIKGQVDFALSDKAWNQGLMSEALAKVIRWAFARYPEMMRIQGMHLPQNIGSGRVMLKSGMQHEGVLRKSIQWKGLSADLVMCAIVRGDHLK